MTMSNENKPKSITELMFSEEYRKRMEDFDRDIEELNKKYAGQLEKGDSLGKHVFIQYPNSIDGHTYFNITDADEIPNEAKVEMRNLFIKHYDTPDKAD
jgi:hypothetical protein